MDALLSAAGRAFLRTFGAAIVVAAPGILAAPNLNRMYLLGFAALAAAAAAGIRSLKAFVPQLSFAAYLPAPFGGWVDAFAQAAIGALVVTLPGALGAPDLATGRALATAALVGAFTAGFQALQNVLTPGDAPAPSVGVRPPSGA